MNGAQNVNASTCYNRQQYIVVVAIDLKGGFSKDHKIPWHYPEDLSHFSNLTKGGYCMMGRHTYEEINQARIKKGNTSNSDSLIVADEVDPILPNRTTYVVSSTLQSVSNATIIKNFSDMAFDLSDKQINSPIFVLGGERIYRMGLAFATDVYITMIEKDFNCDQKFPLSYVLNKFSLVSAKQGSTKELKFLQYRRK